MKKPFDICWHGRGGQGAVTAAKILAEAALGAGKFIQAFPEFGPERAGAPVRSFTRISDAPIVSHSPVTNPDIVVVLDPTLIGVVDVTEGLSEQGIVLVNTPRPASEVRAALKLNGRKVFTADATKIALEKIGRNIPNTPMIGALLKVTGVLKQEDLIGDFRAKYAKKFKPEVLAGNIAAIEAAFNEVKAE